jgi:RND superfamily putative drug exporter
LKHDSQVYFVGATPSIRDLKSVTGGDQVRIDILVIASVFLILVLLLRKVAISGYLIVSVFFSYLVTLGFTFAVFWAMDPAEFAGLDWKVPMFLFTILIAVGEDYNIYLITRIDEEQLRHGKVQGVTMALSKTGKIISSCGLIMAGTFASLAIGGSLAAMRQLGFALAAGVLLDTFVVRPVLVPAYLILLYRGRFGFLGRFLGAESGKTETETTDPPQAVASPNPSNRDTGLSSKAG